jgi:methionyl-tRNA formyltransferase
VSRLVLAGSRSFGAAVLVELFGRGHAVDLVVAPPGDRLHNVARYDLRIETAPALAAEQIADVGADLLVGAHSHQFFGRKTRAATRHGALVGHPSLLPRHRGRDAVEWTIRMRDPFAGFSWFLADDGVDTGPIIAQSWCHVAPRWDAHALWREALFGLGVSGAHDAVRGATEGKPGAAQDPRFATWEPALDAARLMRPELLELTAG